MISANVDLGDIIDRVSHAITTNDGSAIPRVQAKTYTATFDATGLHFSPHRPQPEGTPATAVAPTSGLRSRRFPVGNISRSLPVPDAETEVMLRTYSVRSGDQLTYEWDGRPVAWVVQGNTAQKLLDQRVGLVEHGEALGTGVQLSWVLTQRPEAKGPLAIELELNGLAYAGTSEQGIHLADGTGTPRVCVGKAVAVDSAGVRSEVTTAVEHVGW